MPNKKLIIKILTVLASLALVLRFRNQLAIQGSRIPGFKQLAGL